MVAVIHHSDRTDKMLNYNEHKVSEGVAKCLEAGYYPKQADALNFYQKLAVLDSLRELSTRKINSVHISLNFDPSEKLSEEKLRLIAADYLERIGFGGQPYLLYEHYDSGHPHVHIVTTNIRPDGSAIELHNIGRNQSEVARKAIELAYNLVKAEDQQRQERQRVKPVNVQKALYGKTETKRAISGVLSYVLSRYKYTSLPELNAVLQGYHIIADRGEKGSRTYEHQGLFYRLLDERGRKVGVPIKASDFHRKPTLKYLEQQFSKNEAARLKDKTRLQNAIDLQLLRRPTLNEFTTALKKEGIDTVLRRSPEGAIYGITFVDHRTGAVFNGSDLGRAYSAKALQEKCVVPQKMQQSNSLQLDITPLADTLLQADDFQSMDWQLKRTQQKKKRQTNNQ